MTNCEFPREKSGPRTQAVGLFFPKVGNHLGLHFLSGTPQTRKVQIMAPAATPRRMMMVAGSPFSEGSLSTLFVFLHLID